MTSQASPRQPWNGSKLEKNPKTTENTVPLEIKFNGTVFFHLIFFPKNGVTCFYDIFEKETSIHLKAYPISWMAVTDTGID